MASPLLTQKSQICYEFFAKKREETQEIFIKKVPFSLLSIAYFFAQKGQRCTIFFRAPLRSEHTRGAMRHNTHNALVFGSLCAINHKV